MCFGPGFIIWSFSKLLITEILQSQIKIHCKCQKPTKIWTFLDLRSIMSHFLTKVCNTSLKPTGLSVHSLLNVCYTIDSKKIRKVHKLHKNKNVEIFRLLWRVSEVFLGQNAATFSSKTVLHRSFARC